MNKLKQQHGMTLVEVTVALLLISIIMGASIYFFLTLSNIYRFNTEVSERRTLCIYIIRSISEKISYAYEVEVRNSNGGEDNQIVCKLINSEGKDTEVSLFVPEDETEFKGRLFVNERLSGEAVPFDGMDTPDDESNVFGNFFYGKYHISLDAETFLNSDDTTEIGFTITLIEGSEIVYKSTRYIQLLNTGI